MADVQAAINDLSERFCIDAEMTALENLEIGLNLPLSFSPARVIVAAIVCHNKAFTAFDASTPNLGKRCKLSEYEVKIYDKSKQTGNLSTNLLRVEVKVKKMRYLDRYNLRTLADLTNPAKVRPLIGVLLSAISGTVFIDPAANLAPLTLAERADYYRFQIPSTWSRNPSEVNFWKRQDYRQRINRLLEKCNAFDYVHALREGIADEWETLFITSSLPENGAKSATGEATEKAMFSPLEYVCETIAITLPEKGEKEKDKYNPKGEPVRICVSCGKPLTNQKAYSFFCSEKYNGAKAARRCRNRDSNQRRAKRNQVMRAKVRNQFLQVTYSVDGATYTDILHSTEVGVNRADLDKVVSITILPDCPLATHSGPDCYGHCRCSNPESLTGNKARTLLADLTTQNAPECKPPMLVDENLEKSANLKDQQARST